MEGKQLSPVTPSHPRRQHTRCPSSPRRSTSPRALLTLVSLQRKSQPSLSTMGKLVPPDAQLLSSLPWRGCLLVRSAHAYALNEPRNPSHGSAPGTRRDGQSLTDDSSGMCKAGFAGDDAPRAVFRKSTPLSSATPLLLRSVALYERPLAPGVQSLTLCSLHCRSPPSPWVRQPSPS